MATSTTIRHVASDWQAQQQHSRRAVIVAAGVEAEKDAVTTEMEQLKSANYGGPPSATTVTTTTSTSTTTTTTTTTSTSTNRLRIAADRILSIPP